MIVTPEKDSTKKSKGSPKPKKSYVYSEHREFWTRYADAIRPLEDMLPSEFAVKYRIMHEIYCSEQPGPWDNTVFPYQPHAMDVVKEAIETGKRGVVFMKAGQIGGTDAMINADCWLKEYYPGPQLFMTSTENVAEEFGRERFEMIIADMEPLRKKLITTKRTQILTKRFTDGKIKLSGGQSIFKLQSTPYRFVTIDELDSLVENLGGEGDPLKLAEVRTDAFRGETLIIAYAHPTTRDRGAGKLYYESSDQRRGFVTHDCGHSFWLQWEHVRSVPAEGQSQGDAEVDPDSYVYICPQCGAVVEDAERVKMVRGMRYQSVLPPEVAQKKAWIGIHASQLYSPAKTIRSFAQRWIECKCGADENATRVFYNKVLGETYEPKVQKIGIESLRALIIVKRRANDPEFYLRGQVPPGVRFLTAGQDSRSIELHYAIWGWGLRRAVDKTVSLCGWLIDWGVIKRAYSLTFSESEYHVFDDLIYNRQFASSVSDRFFNVRLCGHDIGYAPTQTSIVRYCRNYKNRAAPAKGASLTATSASNAPYARWGTPMKIKVTGAGGEEEIVTDETSRPLILNTFMLKTDLMGWMEAAKKIEVADAVDGQTIGVRKVPRILFPEDVDEQFLEQTKNEALVNGKKTGELIWKKTGPNHFADCNTYAYGCALQLDPFQKNMTSEEYQLKRPAVRPPSNEDYPRDPSMG